MVAYVTQLETPTAISADFQGFEKPDFHQSAEHQGDFIFIFFVIFLILVKQPLVTGNDNSF